MEVVDEPGEKILLPLISSYFLASLRRDRDHLLKKGKLRSSHLEEIVENVVLNAVRKTAEVEGFSVVLDAWGNFVYGSPEVDLTDKVITRPLRDMSGTAVVLSCLLADLLSLPGINLIGIKDLGRME